MVIEDEKKTRFPKRRPGGWRRGRHTYAAQPGRDGRRWWRAI